MNKIETGQGDKFIASPAQKMLCTPIRVDYRKPLVVMQHRDGVQIRDGIEHCPSGVQIGGAASRAGAPHLESKIGLGRGVRRRKA